MFLQRLEARCCINEKGDLRTWQNQAGVYHFVWEPAFFKSYPLLVELADIAASRDF